MEVSNQEVQAIIDHRIAEAGLAGLVDLRTGHIVPVADGFFVELAIHDVSRADEVEKVIKGAQEELSKDNVRLEVLIRPIWHVEGISYIGPAYSDAGTPRTAVSFAVDLVSGQKRETVTVNVTIAAIDIVRQKLGIEQYSRFAGWSPQNGDVSERCLQTVITSFIDSQFQTEGATFWDPLSQHSVDIDSGSAMTFLGESTAFRDLRNAIRDAFTEPVARHFLTDLQQRHIDVKDFDRVLPDLSNLFGGAYGPSDRFLTSAVDLYSRLRPAEQKLLRCYYDELAERVP